MSGDGVQSVSDFTTSIKKLLARAKEIKPDGGVEPVLITQDFGYGFEEIKKQPHGQSTRDYAAIETACRNIFYNSLASTSIEQAAFGEVWNLFDILSILSDQGNAPNATPSLQTTDNIKINAKLACSSG